MPHVDNSQDQGAASTAERPQGGGTYAEGCLVTSRAQLPELIIPAPTVTPVASSMRMNDPVVRFWE